MHEGQANLSSPQDAVRAYFASLCDSDVEAIVSLFSDDAVVMANGSPTATGRAELRSMYEALLSRVKVDNHVNIDGVLESGDLAAAHTHSAGAITRLGSGATSDVAARELFVLRRAGDEWRITHYMFNSPGST